MQADAKEWLVLLVTGKVLGPLSTAELLDAIRLNRVGLDEKIKHLTRGTWFPISQEPIFYDHLLDALSAGTLGTEKVDVGARPQIPREQLQKSNSPAETPGAAQTPAIPQPPLGKSVSELTVVNGPGSRVSKGFFSSSVPPAGSASASASVSASVSASIHSGPRATPIADDENTFIINAQATKQRNQKKPVFLIAFVAVIVALGAAILILPDKDEHPRAFHLLRPKLTTQTESPTELNASLKKILGTFQNQTYSSDLSSQSALVNLVERGPQFSAARGFLCLVYRDLWPYAEQDREDRDTVTEMVKTTRNLDPAGGYGTYCEVSRLLMLGKASEARGVLDFTLNQPSFATDPVVILMKAEVLAMDQDFLSAKLFSETARKIWPQWIKPILFDGEQTLKLGKKAEALHIFEEALRILPTHPDALVQVGALAWEISHDDKRANNLLSAAIQSQDLKSRPLMAMAYYTLAQIADFQGNRADAVKKAALAYSIQPGKTAYRDLLVLLGGDPQHQKFSRERHELILLGDEYRRAGDCFSAQAEYRAAFELNDDSGIAATRAAQCLWEMNQENEALKWAKKALTADPDYVQAYTTYSDFLAQRFQFQEAFAVLEAAVRHFPNNSEVLRALGLFEFRRHNDKDSVNYLERALKQDEQDLDTLILLARANLRLKDYNKVQNYAVRALELEGTSTDGISIYAENLSAFKGVDAAVFYLKDQIAKYAQSIPLRMELAQIYFDADKFKEAEAIDRQVLEVQPKNKKAQLALAESLQGLALFDQAVPEFLNAALIDPTDPEPYFKLGMLFIDQHKPQAALAQFQKTEQRNPLYPRLYTLMGRAALESQDTATALSYIEKEKANNPNLAESYLLAAEIYDKRGEYQKCASEYQQAVRLRPQGGIIYVKMAKCYRLGGSADVAESMLNVATSIESGLPEIYEEQGFIFEQKGDNQAAQLAFEKYLGLSPNAPDKVLIEDKLKSLPK